MNLLKFKAFLIVLFLAPMALASGGGDPGPTIITYVTYTCTAERSPLSIEMTSVSYETDVIPLDTIKVSGLKNAIELVHNRIISADDQYKFYAGQFPSHVSNSRFFVEQRGVAGYGLYRDANYQIGIFSNRVGSSTGSLDVFITDLKTEKRESLLKIPCVLKIETIEK